MSSRAPPGQLQLDLDPAYNPDEDDSLTWHDWFMTIVEENRKSQPAQTTARKGRPARRPTNRRGKTPSSANTGPTHRS